jgi:hypothetical protein
MNRKKGETLRRKGSRLNSKDIGLYTEFENIIRYQQVG